MKLTEYSRNRLMKTFSECDVPKEFTDSFYNYLVCGWSPGSCFSAILANDFAGAIQKSHLANTVNAFKSIVLWIAESAPHQAYGSYNKVSAWCYLHDSQRRSILEHHRLIFTEEQEVWMLLKNEPTAESILY